MVERIKDLKQGWIICNVLPLIAVIIPLFMDVSLYIILPGFIAYSFGLVVANYYLFDQHLKVNMDEIKEPDTLKAKAVLTILILAFVYVLYHDALADDDRLIWYLIFSIILTFWAIILSYQLSLPSLRKQELEEIALAKEMQQLRKKRKSSRAAAKGGFEG